MATSGWRRRIAACTKKVIRPPAARHTARKSIGAIVLPVADYASVVVTGWSVLSEDGVVNLAQGRSTGETRFRIFRIEHREKHRSLRMTHAAVS
jgi:hypothetical protein